MITYDEFEDYAYGQIDESGAGINRVLSQLENGNDFVVISAFRFDNSKKENVELNSALLRDIRQEFGSKQGAYKLVGHWKECSEPLEDGETIKDCKGTIENAVEESWLIEKPDTISTEQFAQILPKIANKYKQDAYVVRLNGKLTLNGKDGAEWEDLGKVSKESLSQGFSRILSKQGYSELAKHRKHGRNLNIIFEDLNIIVPKDSNSSKQLFSVAGFLY